MGEEEKPDTSLEAKQMELLGEALTGWRESAAKGDYSNKFVQLKTMPPLMKLSREEIEKEEFLRKRTERIVNAIDRAARCLKLDDDYFDTSVTNWSFYDKEKADAEVRELRRRSLSVKIDMVDKYENFVMGLLHKLYLSKDGERKA